MVLSSSSSLFVVVLFSFVVGCWLLFWWSLVVGCCRVCRCRGCCFFVVFVFVVSVAVGGLMFVVCCLSFVVLRRCLSLPGVVDICVMSLLMLMLVLVSLFVLLLLLAVVACGGCKRW